MPLCKTKVPSKKVTSYIAMFTANSTNRNDIGEVLFAVLVNPSYTGRLFHFICWTSPLVILRESGLFCRFYSIFDRNFLLANIVDPDQTPHHVASDIYLHCMTMTF